LIFVRDIAWMSLFARLMQHKFPCYKLAMKNLKSVSNSALLQDIKNLVSEERRNTLTILWHLREIESRRLFAELGYASLFDYAVRDLSYSESAAYRRISAMRALKETPSLEASIESGKISISTVSQVQSFLRAEKLKRGKSYTPTEKAELFSSMQGKSARVVEAKLAELAPGTLPRERERALSENQTEIKFVAGAELMHKLARIRSLHSHRLKLAESYAELFEFLADEVLKKMEPVTRAKQSVATSEVKVHSQGQAQQVRNVQTKASGSGVRAVRDVGLRGQRSRYVPIQLRRAVWNRTSGKCAYVNAESDVRCHSTHKLQLEHIEPFGKGGSSHDPANLTLLCAVHQQWRAIEAYGVMKIAQFVPGLRK
jgi:hypothetical protein